MSRNIKLLAGFNVLAWVVIVPVLAIALVDAPVRLVDRPDRPLDRLDGGVVALGNPPQSRERAVGGARVGLNTVEGVTGRGNTVRVRAVREPAASRTRGVAPATPNASLGRAPTQRLNAVELRGQVGQGRAGGPAPMGRARPNVDGSPAPGTVPPSAGLPPQTTQPQPESSTPPQEQPATPKPPPTLARPPADPTPDPEADPPQSPPDGTPPTTALPPPPGQQPPADPPQSPPEPPPPGTMGAPQPEQQQPTSTPAPPHKRR